MSVKDVSSLTSAILKANASLREQVPKNPTQARAHHFTAIDRRRKASQERRKRRTTAPNPDRLNRTTPRGTLAARHEEKKHERKGRQRNEGRPKRRHKPSNLCHSILPHVELSPQMHSVSFKLLTQNIPIQGRREAGKGARRHNRNQPSKQSIRSVPKENQNENTHTKAQLQQRKHASI